MDVTLRIMFPWPIPDDFERFLEYAIPAILDCSHCVSHSMEGPSVVHARCCASIVGPGIQCDHCRSLGLACDGEFVPRDRVIWYLARAWESNLMLPPPEPEVPLPPFALPTPPFPQEPVDDWPNSPPWSAPSSPGSPDPDYAPSEATEEEEVEPDPQEELMLELFGEELPREAAIELVPQEVLALVREALETAPWAGSSRECPILIVSQ